MFLDRIVRDKRDELEHSQKAVPLSELETAIKRKPQPRDLAAALAGNGISLIAEVKRASPSKGVIRTTLDPAALASTYAESGATAVSVLTESRYFQGSRSDLESVRLKLPDTPLLRKDFILSPYQVYEARAWGADALLLIVAILADKELDELLSLSHKLGMRCLVEVHSEGELTRALDCGSKIIGINNRDLDTMTVDINVTRRLRPLIPPGRIVISESGIKSRQDMDKLREWNTDAVLIGEALVTANDIAAKIKELL
ncbi:indole-3-glycerol phosphate synthase TrpC [Chloroflexota bacterium]